jgi:arylesterase/paraoxonase
VSGQSDLGAIIAMDIDVPSPDGISFSHRALGMPGFFGTAGDGRLHPIGLTGIQLSDTGTIRLLVVNDKPSVDPATGDLLDQWRASSNNTIEEFEVILNSQSIKHIRTIANDAIATPNNVAIVSPGTTGVYITNDHGFHKSGIVCCWPCF